MKTVQWGIIGPGSIAANFAQGLAECDHGTLYAIASRDAERCKAFGERFSVPSESWFNSYDELLAAPQVAAVYIATPHPFHADLVIRALRASKHVVVEKPAGLIPGEVVAMTDVAKETGRFFMEGFMYRCHPQIERLVELIGSGEIGKVEHIEASFGFISNYNPDSRLDKPDLAGGAILDVGVYPVSFARLVAGAAQGLPFAEPLEIQGIGSLGPLGVDETAYALLQFDQGITASCSTSIRRAMDNSATIIGSKGRIHLPNPWIPGRDTGPSDAIIEIEVAGQKRVEQLKDSRILFAHEAELASCAILDGLTEAPSPAPQLSDSVGNARVIATWREGTGYKLPGESPAHIRSLNGTLPSNLPAIPRVEIPGMTGEISALIIGCDNRDTLDEGAIVWDAWWESGGNGFDTGFIYGGGVHETVLGQWMAARGIAKEARVVIKGAHSPYCLPDVIATQLAISLERLQIERAPIYIMHRDNPDVPVGEFLDALNALHDKGLIETFGGSNWSIKRFKEANSYAASKGLQPLKILNNNLSLAVMEKPVWDGCITSNTPEMLGFLRKTSTTHLSWSSQARGYFLQPGQGTALSPDTTGDVCFSSEANAERRRRATQLAAEHGVKAQNIATAWVLGQQFPSLALIGPRSPSEIVTTLPAMTVSLSAREVAWLNLESSER